MVSRSLILRRKYSVKTRLRKARQRARELWRRLQYEGWGSIEELQKVANDPNIPETWQGSKFSEIKGMENVTADDMPPSRRTIRTLAGNLK